MSVLAAALAVQVCEEGGGGGGNRQREGGDESTVCLSVCPQTTPIDDGMG